MEDNEYFDLMLIRNDLKRANDIVDNTNTELKELVAKALDKADQLMESHVQKCSRRFKK